MTIYDLYLFDTDLHVAVGWHKFESGGDDAAMAFAAAMALNGTHELWRDQLLVKRWEQPN